MKTKSLCLVAAAIAVFGLGADEGPQGVDWSTDGANLFFTQGNVGIGTSNPTARLDVRDSANTVVFIKNNKSSAAAIGIKAQSVSTSGKALVGIASSSTGNTIGVQGESKSESGIGVKGFAKSATGASTAVLGQNLSTDGIGLHGLVPESSAATAGFFQGGFNRFETNVESLGRFIEIERLSTHNGGNDLLELTIPDGSSDTSEFIEAERGADTEFRVQGDGNVFADGAFTGGGADYAEWMQLLNTNESLQPGDVVGVFGGRVSHRTQGAQQVLVVSTNPVVIGNGHAEADLGKDQEAVIAMLGQAPVRVRGAVKVGDFIIASGSEDGTALAVAPAEMTLALMPRLIGTAWDAAEGEGIHSINTSIGLDQRSAIVSILAEREMRIAELSRAVEAQQVRLAELEAAVVRLLAQQ